MTEIKIGGTYYYNNRQVVVLRKETEDMFFVEACVGVVETDLKGYNFCDACNIGDSDNKLSHTCKEAEYIIEDIEEQLWKEKELFWVHRKTLKENYFEYKANEKMAQDTQRLKNEYKELKKEIENAKKQKEDFLQQAEKERVSLIKLTEERNAIMEEIVAYEKQKAQRVDLSATVKVANTDMKVSDLLELYKSDITLRYLEASGVDNWEGYDIAFDDVDIEEEALLRLQGKQ